MRLPRAGKAFGHLRRTSRTIRDDVDEEIRLHLEMQVEALAARGVPLDEARREARRRFGDLEATRKYCRAQDERKESTMRHTLLFQDIGQDAAQTDFRGHKHNDARYPVQVSFLMRCR